MGIEAMGATTSLVRLPAAVLVAPAKLNLALHVVGRRADGYHLLSSLVAFAQGGDVLRVAPALEDFLRVEGPFAEALGTSGASRNLVSRAVDLARAVAAPHGIEIAPLAIALDKRLPVASGIGGGSADAAAILRHVRAACPRIADVLRTASLRLGADVPMCIDGVPAFVEGIGERVAPLSRFPEIACLLVNPGLPVSTPDVFARLTRSVDSPLPPLPLDGFERPEAVFDYLRGTRNDLEAAAESIVPEIAAARKAVIEAGAAFARMSGSGATVFGLFDSDAAVGLAARRLAEGHPDWWIMATRLGPTSQRSTPG